MRIATRFILSVAGVLVASLLAAGWSWQHVQEDRLEADAARQTQGVAVLLQTSRDYAADLQRPGGIRAIGGPFSKLQSGYQIKEASDNPINPADRPDPAESDLLARLRANPRANSSLFLRDEHGGEWYIAARPIVAENSCLQCHGSPEQAPRAMTTQYGSTHGYGWKTGQVVGVQTVRLNLAENRAAQSQVSSRLLVWGCQLGLAALIGVYVFARWIVIKPLTQVSLQMREIAERRSYTFPLEEAERRDELGMCATAFNHLLGVVRDTVNDLSDTNAHLEQRVAERTLELEQQKERVEAATRAKSDFLANMSHEIRTPLSGAIGAMQLLESTPLNDRQKKFASTGRACASALLSLINDILDFSKIEAGKLELVREAFDLRQMVDETIAIFLPRAAQKDLSLTCQIEKSVPAGLWGDSSRLRQILVNLVGNAIKFTHTGGIEVHVQSFDRSGDFHTLKFSVRDTGIGIPANRLDRLFQSFSQVDGSTTRQYGGTGLGLAITRQLAEMMGGSVGVESQEGAGSTFWITAKLQEAAIALSASHQLQGGSNSARLARILLVDDNEVNQMILCEMLKQAGHEVQSAANGQQALELYQMQPFDLIFTDCQMPVMDGYMLASTIREKESAPPGASHVPIIALTASATKRDLERCLEAGMDDYAVKPVSQERLMLLIHQWMPKAAANAPAPSCSAAPQERASFPEKTIHAIPPIPPPSASANSLPIEMESLLHRCMGDANFAQTMLDRFQSALNESLADIEKAFGSASSEAASKSAHKLKGSASYLSAEPIRHFAAEIETLARDGKMESAEQSLSQLRIEVQRCQDFIKEFLSKPKTNDSQVAAPPNTPQVQPGQSQTDVEALEFADQ